MIFYLRVREEMCGLRALARRDFRISSGCLAGLFAADGKGSGSVSRGQVSCVIEGSQPVAPVVEGIDFNGGYRAVVDLEVFHCVVGQAEKCDQQAFHGGSVADEYDIAFFIGDLRFVDPRSRADREV